MSVSQIHLVIAQQETSQSDFLLTLSEQEIRSTDRVLWWWQKTIFTQRQKVKQFEVCSSCHYNFIPFPVASPIIKSTLTVLSKNFEKMSNSSLKRHQIRVIKTVKICSLSEHWYIWRKICTSKVRKQNHISSSIQ